MVLDRVEYIAYRRLPGLIDAWRLLAGGGAKPRGEVITGGGVGEENGNKGSLWLKGSVCVRTRARVRACVFFLRHAGNFLMKCSHSPQQAEKRNLTTDKLHP